MSESKHLPVPGISGSTLKLIAIITMFIDHTGATVLRAILNQPSISSTPGLRIFWSQVYSMSRSIGRIAFPIFCFLLVEGFTHTRNVKKYAGRLFLFALVSEIPFDLALKGNWYFPAKQNVYFTLLIGLLVLMGFSRICGITAANSGESGTDPETPDRKTGRNETDPEDPNRKTMRSEVHPTILKLLFPFVLVAGMYLALWIDTDYNFKGVFLIAVLYLLHSDRMIQCVGGAVAVAWEMPAPVAFLPVYLYNGSRGLRMKYFFYWFYPVHLLLLHCIATYLVPAILS